jgi:DNA-binding NarL/FixJ family response regulator
LQSFYRTGTLAERQIIDVKEIIGEMTVLLRGEADRHSITIHPELEADTPKIVANRVQLQQVFMNLMLNAIEAMKNTGGELSIRSRLHPEGRLIVSISDTGVGLSAESTEGASDFFTKPVDGAALLSSVERALQQNLANRREATERASLVARYESLTPREREVLPLLAGGLLNKQVAFELGITEWTVQLHRGHIMRKMQADSFAGLVKMADKLSPDHTQSSLIGALTST